MNTICYNTARTCKQLSQLSSRMEGAAAKYTTPVQPEYCNSDSDESEMVLIPNRGTLLNQIGDTFDMRPITGYKEEKTASLNEETAAGKTDRLQI